MTSCAHLDQKDEYSDQEYVETTTLRLLDSVSYPLDSVTGNVTFRMQIFEDDIEYFAFLNIITNSIYLYDLRSTKFVKSIALDESQGLHGAEGFTIFSMDTIVVTKRYHLFLVNDEGEVFYRINLLDKAESVDASVGVLVSNNLAPIIFEKPTKLHIVISPDLYEDDLDGIGSSRFVYKLDLKNGHLENMMNYPSILSKDYYTPYMVFFVGVDYNERKNCFVYSFPADQNLYVTSSTTATEAELYYAGSSNYGKIEPASKDAVGNPRLREYYFRTTLSYGRIIHDEYRNLYYRIFWIPVSEEDFLERKFAKNAGIIVLDSAFRKVGEVVLPDNLSGEQIVIGRKGIYIQVRNEVESKMRFMIYTPAPA